MNLEILQQLRQSIHNLKMRFPIGIKSIDNEHDEKLKRKILLLELLTNKKEGN